MRNLQVNGERLWASLMELAQIGATAEGRGVPARRQRSRRRGAAALHPLVRGGRLHGHGRPDRQHLRAPARPQPDLPPVMTGSHLDTQPTGGKFDGAYGVMAGLEVVRTLNDLGYETEAPIEIVAWTNEEGSRFSPAMVGSGAFTGVFELDEGLARPRQRDRRHPRRRTRAHRLCRPGAGRRAPGRRLFRGAYRAGADPRSGGPADRHRHRRAGPALVRDHRHRPGGACRADADAAPARRAGRRRAHDRRGQPDRPCACALCLRHGRLCPGQPQFAQHDPRPGVLHGRFPPSRRRGADRDGPRIAAACDRAAAIGLEVEVKEFWYFPPTPFDADLVAAVRDAAEAQGYPHQDIISGAGHDAVYMARVAPTAMIFVPCVGGISHNEIEDAKPDDLTAGCKVLLNACSTGRTPCHPSGHEIQAVAAASIVSSSNTPSRLMPSNAATL